MDYDKPYRQRSLLSAQLADLLLLVALGGLIWILFELWSFRGMIDSAERMSAVVVRYEKVVGEELIRVKGTGKRGQIFILAHAPRWGGRFAEKDEVQVLLTKIPNNYGAIIERASVYPGKHFWSSILSVGATSLLVIVLRLYSTLKRKI